MFRRVLPISVAGSPRPASRASWDGGVRALGEGGVELLSGDESVGDTEIAVHDGYVGSFERKGPPGGAVDKRMEAAPEIVVVGHELPSPLVGGSP